MDKRNKTLTIEILWPKESGADCSVINWYDFNTLGDLIHAFMEDMDAEEVTIRRDKQEQP